MRPRLLSSLALLSTLSLAAPALAQGTPSTLAPADEIRALQVEIDRDVAVLATGSCTVACQALASMRRAAERMCGLDPGQRCAEARAKVRDAGRRVQEACGECAPLGGQASSPVVPEKPASMKEKGAEHQQVPPPAPPPPPSAPSPKQANEDVAQPEAVRAPPRGGCAGCFVGGDDVGPAGAGLLAMVAALAASARRRRRRG